jgi:hypothetical protein
MQGCTIYVMKRGEHQVVGIDSKFAESYQSTVIHRHLTRNVICSLSSTHTKKSIRNHCGNDARRWLLIWEANFALVDNEPRGTWAIRYTDANPCSSDGRGIPCTIDVRAGVTAEQARVDCRFHKACSWVPGRKFFRRENRLILPIRPICGGNAKYAKLLLLWECVFVVIM